jgi:hypothetical protein
VPIAALPSYPPAKPPMTDDELRAVVDPPVNPDAREWRRQWTWRDALKEPAEFWRSTFDRPPYYTEQGRENLLGKAEGLSSGIAKSGALGEHLKELSAKAPRWFHFQSQHPTALDAIDVKMLEEDLAHNKQVGHMTPQGVAYIENILKKVKARENPETFVQRLPPTSEFGFEPGALSTTTRTDAFGQSRPAIVGKPNVKVREMAEGATPEGIEAQAKILYPAFSSLRLLPRKIISAPTQAAIENAATTTPFTGYTSMPTTLNESIEAGKRLRSTLDKPQSIADLAAMKGDLQKLSMFTPAPTTELHSKQMTPFNPSISEGNLGHYLRRLATRELAKQDVKAIAHIPHGDYSEFETTLVRPDAWRGVERIPPFRTHSLWEQAMEPTTTAQSNLSEQIETTGPYHGNPSSAGRAILLHLFKMMGR